MNFQLSCLENSICIRAMVCLFAVLLHSFPGFFKAARSSAPGLCQTPFELQIILVCLSPIIYASSPFLPLCTLPPVPVSAANAHSPPARADSTSLRLQELNRYMEVAALQAYALRF